MALNAYLSNTALLLQNPAAPTSLYSTANLSTWINTARTQLAGQTECIRSTVTLSVTSVTSIYPFSSVTNLPAGVQGIYNVRQINRVSGTGVVYMGSRPYPWAETYWQQGSAPVATTPTEWSQYGIGTAGSLVLDHTPDASYVLKLDASCYPILLASDSDPEAIPYAYTDAVPYLAAYYAYMSAQRQQDAQTMLGRYEDFVSRAKKIAVPNVLPVMYDQMQAPPPQQAGGG